MLLNWLLVTLEESLGPAPTHEQTIIGAILGANYITNILQLLVSEASTKRRVFQCGNSYRRDHVYGLACIAISAVICQNGGLNLF